MLQEFLTKFQKAAQIDINLADWVWAALRIALIFAAAALIIKVISAITGGVIKKQKAHDSVRAKRLGSLMTLTRSLARYLVYFIAIAMTLSVFGWGKGVTSLLATAGIGGLAIGFGAQNLVRDVVTGLFMMFENQYSVGDYISIDGAEGTVEAIALRTTYLRTFRGDRHIIPNGSINHVINLSGGEYLALVDIGTSYDSDTASVMQIIGQAANRYADAHTDIVKAPPKVLGVAELGEYQVVIRVVCEVLSMRHFEVERGIRLAVKQEFDRLGLPFPYPRRIMEIKHVKDAEKDVDADIPFEQFDQNEK